MKLFKKNLNFLSKSSDNLLICDKILSEYKTFSNEIIGGYIDHYVKKKYSNSELGMEDSKRLEEVVKKFIFDIRDYPNLFNYKKFIERRRDNLDKNFKEFIEDFAIENEAYEFLNYLKEKYK